MTNEERVKERYPDAVAVSAADGGCLIMSDSSATARLLGEDDWLQFRAWADALDRMEKERG